MSFLAGLSLPIIPQLPGIRQALEKHTSVILQADPGAGKSTIVPLALLDEAWLAGQKIIMLEPRRLAASSVATRMAQLLGEAVGNTAGYRVRFETRTSTRTRIEVVTEGILTRMIQQDNALEGVGLLIFDEFHERSLQSDLALALAREVQQVLREDLRLLIMSATLDTEGLSSLLGGAPVLRSEGRQYPVALHYQPSRDATELLPSRMAASIRQAMQAHPGDVLAFLPGAGEIERCRELLERTEAAYLVYPLYGDLPPQAQQAAIRPDAMGRRKIVLATSIAETSLTIEGIGIVVDSGLARRPRFDPRSGLSRLETVPITQDAATQRTGRAGRLGPGVCYRLWSEAAQAALAPHRKAEILEADLAPTVLELAGWGRPDVEGMAWLTAPPRGAVSQAKDVLLALDALDKAGKITERGRQMVRLPTHPRLAHMLLEGQAVKLPLLAADLAALLEERDPLPRHPSADITERLEWLHRTPQGQDRGLHERISRLAAQWQRLLGAGNSQPTHYAPTEAGLLLSLAYPERIARRRAQPSESYRLAGGRGARLPAQDPLAGSEWLAIATMDAGQAEGKIYLAAPLDMEDVRKLARWTDVVDWDLQAGKLVARHELRLGPLLVESRPMKDAPEPERTQALCQAVREEGLALLGWEEADEQWQARLASLQNWRPQESWPDVSTEKLLATVEDWLGGLLAGVRTRADFARISKEAIKAVLLPWPLPQQLEASAPAALAVPSGFTVKLHYQADGEDPVLAVRIQEMFGLADTPTVNEGRTRVLVHLLSPGYKPVQVTQDLRSFWNSTYTEVRRELRIRYPRHAWPDDPWSAPAVRGPVKRRIV